MTNKMQLFGLSIYSQSALRVSGDVFAHHQEHLTVFTSSDILLQAGVTTPAGSSVGGLYQKL